MRIAIPSIVIDFAPLWIARDKGFFRDERLDAEVTYIQGNIRGVQALIAGEVQFGIAGSAGPIGARAAGEDAVIVAVPMNRLDYTFVARQPVKSAADLAGKKIGIGAVGGSDEVATRIALRQLGVDPAQASQLVAEHLPKIIDHLTPAGKIDLSINVQQRLAVLAPSFLQKLTGKPVTSV